MELQPTLLARHADTTLIKMPVTDGFGFMTSWTYFGWFLGAYRYGTSTGRTLTFL